MIPIYNDFTEPEDLIHPFRVRVEFLERAKFHPFEYHTCTVYLHLGPVPHQHRQKLCEDGQWIISQMGPLLGVPIAGSFEITELSREEVEVLINQGEIAQW